jgi:hypothetical protein
MDGKTMKNPFAWVVLVALVVAAIAAGMSACAEPNPDAYTGATTAEESGVYPHEENFVLPEKHGAAVTDFGLDSCRECHGENLTGGWSNVSCATCHGNTFN